MTPKPAVLQNPEANARLKAGLDTLANLLALTLGPVQGHIISNSSTDARPELLTDSATIARRVLALPNRAEDVGAMLLRNLVWRMHRQVGDGCATTAVLAQAILARAHRYKAAGANAMLLQQGLKQAALAAQDALQQMAWPVEDEEDLVKVAQTATGEPELSLILGEMFDILGPDAHITIEDYVAPYLEREYQEGGRWQGRLASPYFITNTAFQKAVQTGCRVALFAGPVSEPGDVQPLLELVARQKSPRLVLIAHEIKGAALSMLVANHQQQKIHTIAAELRRPDTHRRTDFEDLAALTGARVLLPELGDALAAITPQDLGAARRVEAGAQAVVLVGEPQHADRVRQQIEQLRRRLDALPPQDGARDELRFRLARLSGHVATLKIGAFTKTAREAIRQKANKGLRALPLALQKGVVPGGGIAFLNCIPAVRRVKAEGDAAWGVDILADALQAPARRLLANAGLSSAGAILAQAQRRGPEFGYDVVRKQIVNMNQAGIVDAVGVLQMALQTAVSGAAMALTTDAVVLKRRPETSMEP